MIKFPVRYINGNYMVTIYDDGTKIRVTPDNHFNSTRVETLDINISNYCKNNCNFCFINASILGRHCELNVLRKMQIPYYTEIAINFAEHPQFEEILKIFKEKRCILNITIHQKDLIKYHEKIFEYQKNKLIYGVGVSISEYSSELNKIIQGRKNPLLHVIAGITSLKEIEKFKNQKYNLLILGFKNKGKGKNVVPNLNEYINNYKNLRDWFKIISYDNLAIEQLNIKNFITKEEWDSYYMGNEGNASFYIDLVNNTFAKSSLEETCYPIKQLTIKEMFKYVKN